jgi:hypothetical protein
MDHADIKNQKSKIKLLIFALLLALEVVGCGRLFTRSNSDNPAALRVVARENKDVADLSADDIVRVLQRLGFSDDLVLSLGPDLHDALATAGAAEIRLGRNTEIALAVNGEHLFITSRTRGTFVYSISNGRFGAMPGAFGSR